MDQPRADNGQFISLEKFVMSLMDERISNLDERFGHKQKALELQAKEYERRLEDLNHAHARAQEAQHTFLSIDKYEDQVKAANEARELALNRIDERLGTLDKAVADARGAARKAQEIAEEQGRKSNRNISIASIALAVVIAVANWLGLA